MRCTFVGFLSIITRIIIIATVVAIVAVINAGRREGANSTEPWSSSKIDNDVITIRE